MPWRSPGAASRLLAVPAIRQREVESSLVFYREVGDGIDQVYTSVAYLRGGWPTSSIHVMDADGTGSRPIVN